MREHCSMHAFFISHHMLERRSDTAARRDFLTSAGCALIVVCAHFDAYCMHFVCVLGVFIAHAFRIGSECNSLAMRVADVDNAVMTGEVFPYAHAE